MKNLSFIIILISVFYSCVERDEIEKNPENSQGANNDVENLDDEKKNSDSSTTSAQATFGAQSSNKSQEWDFDFVEEFDGLQSWVRTEGRVGNVGDIDKMPKLADGSDSAWGYYSIWGDSRIPQQDWIGEYGDNRVWRGTKSATIDIGDTAAGQSRFGLYMGKGYKEFHLFFMVNISKNQWPTSCEGDKCSGGGPIGTYSNNEPYSYWAAWKFNTFNMDCPSAICPDRSTYSDKWLLLTSLKKYNYGEAPGVTMHLITSDHKNDDWLRGPVSFDQFIGDWFGIEYRIVQKELHAEISMWVYDQSGNAVLMSDAAKWPTPEGIKAGYWNQFFFGGNNSNSFTWGPSMQSAYYIDDVIIDDQRIGPKYFNYIKQ